MYVPSTGAIVVVVVGSDVPVVVVSGCSVVASVVHGVVDDVEFPMQES